MSYKHKNNGYVSFEHIRYFYYTNIYLTFGAL